MAQTSSLQIQLTTTLGRIQTLEAREPVRTDDPKDVDSSAYFYFLVPSQDEASLSKIRLDTPYGDKWIRRIGLISLEDTLRRYLSSLCTTHELERVEARHALARSKAHNRALEARITVLETYAHRHKRQH
ncbi:hypothetical protein Tco_0157088 [Tanacetum coccineum]